MAKQKPYPYETSGGETIHLLPVRDATIRMYAMRVEQEWRKAGKPVDSPTYTITTVAGDEEVHEHIVDIEHGIDTRDYPPTPEGKARAHAAWEEYQRCMQELESAKADAIIQATLYLGVEENPPADGEWLEPFQTMGIAIPTDPVSFKAFWLTNTVLDDYDVMFIRQQIGLVSMGRAMQDEDREAAFRLIKTGVAQTIHENVERTLARVSVTVDGAIPKAGTANGEGVGPDAEAVG